MSGAIFHMSVKVGTAAKGGAQAHARYDRRDPRWGKFDEHHPVDIHVWNLPAWVGDADQFWGIVDANERKNGSVYREFEVALPHNLTKRQNLEMVKSWVEKEFPHQVVETEAHWKDSNWHAHIQTCERIDDGLKRDASTFFKRYNPKNHVLGGCKKSTRFTCNDLPKAGMDTREYMNAVRAARRQALRDIRASWAAQINTTLERHGHPERVDSRSNKERGIAVAPGAHVGKNALALIKKGLVPDRLSQLIELEQRSEYVTRQRFKSQPTIGCAPAVDRAVQPIKQNSNSNRKTAPASTERNGKPSASQTERGFERVENIDVGELGGINFDSHPNHFNPIKKIHLAGYKRPAYFSKGRSAPVALGRAGGGIAIPHPSSIDDEQLAELLKQVAEGGERIEINGTEEFKERVALLADQYNIKHNLIKKQDSAENSNEQQREVTEMKF
jgi:hypothetical protein